MVLLHCHAHDISRITVDRGLDVYFGLTERVDRAALQLKLHAFIRFRVLDRNLQSRRQPHPRVIIRIFDLQGVESHTNVLGSGKNNRATGWAEHRLYTRGESGTIQRDLCHIRLDGSVKGDKYLLSFRSEIVIEEDLTLTEIQRQI